MLTAVDLIAEIRDALQDPDGRAFGDENHILRVLSGYQRQLYEKARRPGVQAFSQRRSLAFADFTLVRTDEYRRTLRYFERNVQKLERTDTTPPKRIPSRRAPAMPITHYDADRDDYFLWDDGIRYELLGPELRLFGAVPATFTADLWWEHPPPDFLHTVKIKAGSTAVSLIVDLTTAPKGLVRRIDDYYVGAFVVLTTAASTANLGLPVLITAYDGANAGGDPVFTIETLPGAPTAGDLFALASPIPPEFHSLIAIGAALRLAGSRASSKRYQLLSDEVRRGEIEYVASLVSREQADTRHVHETEGSF